MKKAVVMIIFLIAIIIAAAAAIYFTFFYSIKCQDESCFKSALADCNKATYLNEGNDASWFYTINGKSSGECQVQVEILQLKAGTLDIERLQGKSMICSLPLGYTSSPQANLEKCHGILKEEMQQMIINKLHNYITDNVGKIAEELVKPL